MPRFAAAVATGLVLAVCASLPAAAITITEIDEPVTDQPYTLFEADFVSWGARGTGGSVLRDIIDAGLRPALKFRTDRFRYGRFSDSSGEPWMDSQDRGHIRWAVRRTSGGFSFMLTDAFDQPTDDRFGRGHFRFVIRSEGERAFWRIAAQEANGTAHRFLITGLGPTSTITFHTRRNDGFGLSDAVTAPPEAPVPLPAAAWLMLAAVGGLGALGWRRGHSAPAQGAAGGM